MCHNYAISSSGTLYGFGSVIGSSNKTLFDTIIRPIPSGSGNNNLIPIGIPGQKYQSISHLANPDCLVEYELNKGITVNNFKISSNNSLSIQAFSLVGKNNPVVYQPYSPPSPLTLSISKSLPYISNTNNRTITLTFTFNKSTSFTLNDIVRYEPVISISNFQSIIDTDRKIFTVDVRANNIYDRVISWIIINKNSIISPLDGSILDTDVMIDLGIRTVFDTPKIKTINSTRQQQVLNQNNTITKKSARPILEFRDCPLNSGIISVSGGSMSGLYGYGGGIVAFSGLFIPSGNYLGNATVAIDSGKFINTYGNTNNISNEITFRVDTKDLEVVISSTLSDSILSSTDNTRPINFLWNRNIKASTFNLSSISISGGELSLFNGADNKYSALLTGGNINSSGYIYIDEDKVSTLENNEVKNIKSNIFSFIVDNIAPSINISTQLANAPDSNTYLMKNLEDANITFKINKSVTKFNLSKVKVNIYNIKTKIHSSGVLANFSGGGDTYTATYPRKSDAQELIDISIDKDVFQDDAGNYNITSNICSIDLDSRPFQIEDWY